MTLPNDADNYPFLQSLPIRHKEEFAELVNSGESDWEEERKRDILRGMMMMASDVAALCKPWEIQKRVAAKVASEFFEQGDLEKNKLHSVPSAMMDRAKINELPAL